MKSRLALVALAVCLSWTAAEASGLKIIANPSVQASEISADDLKGVFLGVKTSLPDGSAVQPVLAKSGPAHEALLKDHLGKTDAALVTYFRSLVFTGKASMPKMCASEAEMIDYVARTKGAIGYVSAAASAAGVKTIALK